MRVTTVALLLATGANAAFVPFMPRAPSRVVVHGYLDDLSSELNQEVDNPEMNNQGREETNLSKDKQDRFGVGNWDGFVDFDEFDGGDGQMGVAGDGKKGLEKFGSDVSPQLAKSKTMSAKNAWGTATGYSDTLREKGVDTARAQQLENWNNQQELRQRRVQHQGMTDDYDQVSDDNWRMLSKFGVERNQDFDLSQVFGPVTPADPVEGTIELQGRLNQNVIFEMQLKNEFMGFADFRAAFSDDTPVDWSVEPAEGSLSKDPVNFIVKFRPQNPGVSEGWLVIETEDFKKTWKVVGGTA